MPARDIASPNEIWLGDTLFKLKGPVRLTNITVTPNPVVFGDTSKVTDTQFMSQFIQSHSLGGSGMSRGQVRTDFDRHWKSRADTRFRYTCLPPLVTDIDRPSGLAASAEVSAILEHAGIFYVAFGTEIYSYTPSTATWSALLRSVPAPVTDVCVYTNATATYLVFAQSSGYSHYNVGGAAWADDTDDAKYVAVFDDALWMMRATGAMMKVTTAIGTQAASAVLTQGQVPTGLFVYRDANGTSKLYCTTERGLYIFDQTNTKWLQTDVNWPPYENSGKNPLVFRDARAYIKTGGLSMISLEMGDTVIVTPMGLDRDDGVESNETGEIVAVGADYNWIWALVSATEAGTGVAESAGAMGFAGPLGSEGWTLSAGSNSLRAWNGGWHCLWEGEGASYGATALRVSVGDDNSLYVMFSANARVYLMQVPYGIYNPRQNPNWSFQSGPVSHITPWWDLSAEIQEKLVAHVPVFCSSMSATEKIDVYYGTDLSESWTLLGEITEDGLTTLTLGDGAGAKARLWRLRFDFQRGSDATLSPIMDFYCMEFMKLLPATYGYVLEIDTSDQFRGKSPDQQVAALKRLADASETPNLIEFAYQDDLSGTNRTHYARVTRFQMAEYSGRKERGRGTVMLSVIVPYQDDSI